MSGLECSIVRSREWMLTETGRGRLEASEMWVWRRMEKIS